MNGYIKSLILLLLPVCAVFSQEQVMIYRDAAPRLLGQSPSRTATLSAELSQLRRAPFATAPSPVRTAVLLDAGTVRDLQAALRVSLNLPDFSLMAGQNAVFSLDDRVNGIRISFSMSASGDDIEGMLRATYPEAYWRETVMREYAEGMTVNIAGAPDLDGDGSLSFTEALLAATLIGSRTQPLMGMHDGLGYLDTIGYALVRLDNGTAFGLETLVRKASALGGDFAKNLLMILEGMVQFEETPATHLSPEEFLREGEGDEEEYARLFAAALGRKGYYALIIAVRTEEKSRTLRWFTAWREKDGTVWNAISPESARSGVSGRLPEVPARMFAAEVWYAAVPETGPFPPDPSKLEWEHSAF